MDISNNYSKLYTNIFNLYHLPENQSRLLFHGWHHIQFVLKKSIEFASELNCDIEKLSVSALVHDLNYIFSEKTEPEAAKKQILDYVISSGYSEEFSKEIVKIVEDSSTKNRGSRNLSKESMALADADALFKILPVSLILFSSKFLTENKYDISKLAHKVIDEQKPLLNSNIYFYTDMAKKSYLHWAKNNLETWEFVLEALENNDVKEMLSTANQLGVL